MRIRAITPIRVTDEELARRRTRYAELSPPGLSIELVNLPDGPDVPRQLAHPDDIAASDALVAAELIATDPAEFDGAMPDCVLDPGVVVASRQASVPVYGILRLATGVLAGLGHRFAAVTRNTTIGDELVSCVGRYDLQEQFEENAVLDLSFEDIEDDAIWNAAIDRVLGPFAQRGVQSVINGCSAVEVHPREGGAVVVDPTALALRVLDLGVQAGLAGRVATAQTS